MPHIVIDARGIRPIAFDGDEVEPLLDDQFARDALAHPVEFGSAVACLAEQHDARVADPFEQRGKIDGIDRAERLGRVGNLLDQLLLGAGACRRRVTDASRLRLCPSFFAEQRNKSYIGEVFAAIFVFRDPRHPHQFLNVQVRTYRDHQPTADFQLLFERLGDRRATGCDYDRVVGCMLRPTLRPVTV